MKHVNQTNLELVVNDIFCTLAGREFSSDSRSSSPLNVKTGTPETTEKSSLNDKVFLLSGGLQKPAPKAQKRSMLLCSHDS